MAIHKRGKDGDIPLAIYRDFWGVRVRALKEVPKDSLKPGDISDVVATEFGYQ